jgi:hypothetical protein
MHGKWTWVVSGAATVNNSGEHTTFVTQWTEA